jgi:signal transduction histidine kinase
LVLSEVIAECIEDFGEQAAKIGISCPPGLRISADRDHLQQILVNFVGNAFKYGEPPISIEAREAGDWIELVVCDQGEGVPESFVPKLFDKFAQAQTGSTRNAKGTGLGLSIVRGLARAQHGEAWYEPNRPHGSCFGLRLPRESG